MVAGISRIRFGAVLAAAALAGLVAGAPLPARAAERQVIDRIAIVVNTRMVTLRELEELRVLRARDYGARFKGAELEKKMAGIEQDVRDQVVEGLLLETQAEKLGIEVTDQELDERVKAIVQSDPRVAAVYSDRTLREFVLRDLLKQRVLNREVNARIHVSQAEVTRACQTQQGNNDEIDVGHILFRGAPEAALAKAQAARQKIGAGADFEEVAVAQSEDPSAQRNRGRLGFHRRGNFLKAFEDVAFKLKQGELSEPVRTRLGYHLIKVFATRKGSQVDCQNLEAVESKRLEEQLWGEKREKKMETYLADLRQDAEIRFLIDQ